MGSYDVAVLDGDGVGPEVTGEALKDIDPAGKWFGRAAAIPPGDHPRCPATSSIMNTVATA
ncbi:hypothetical protein ACWDKQ_14660 [Saccharopolyspora sp. NPDC000995]